MEANVGDIKATLSVDLSQWSRGLQQASQQLAQSRPRVLEPKAVFPLTPTHVHASAQLPR